ncbi:hypothetical protein Tco_0311585 [Tanacetum coccineum]
MTAEHSSLSFTEEATFLIFSLCERRSLRTLAPFGMWIMASKKVLGSSLSDPSLLIFPSVWSVVVGCNEFGKGGSRVLAPDLVVIAKVKRFPYAFRVEFLFKHETGKLVLKLASGDPFRITFLFSFPLAVSLWRGVIILIESHERGVVIDVSPR